ncbi:unnamed protein product [Effrenium voratum]|nr:unnamed protein product [Effrenium voratum]
MLGGAKNLGPSNPCQAMALRSFFQQPTRRQRTVRRRRSRLGRSMWAGSIQRSGLCHSQSTRRGSVELQLIACEDCGRRFNPASLEKHRAVCRSVFGKTRSTFESHHQRLRGVPEKTPSEVKRRAWEATPQPVATTPTTASSGSSGPRPEKREAAIASCEAAIAQLRAGAIESNGRAKGAVAREPKDLQPCPHCGRSFRPNVVEKHVKVCQSVFPSHDTSFKRRTEGPVLRKGSKASGPSRQANSTPPRSRGSTCGGEPAREREPASPIMSLHSEVPAEPKSQACLDVWEQEVEEAIQAMSEPQEPQVAASPMQGFRALEERATLLERARLGVKMGQKPQQALAGSMSEAVLQTSQKHQSSTPSLASGHTMAARVARVAQASTAPLKLYEAPQASQARGGS